MIICKKHTKNILRTRQSYNTRQDKIRLGMNEYLPSMPDQLFSKIMASFTNEIASSYPEVNQAYNSLSNFLSQPRDRILITSGADMAIRITLDTFCSFGDEISTISPTFAMYKIHANLLGCKLVEKKCDKNGVNTVKDLLSLVGLKTKIVILSNPNGVTGFLFSILNLRKLIKKAEKQNTLVVIDETYVDFSGINTEQLIDEFSNVVIIRSFSKNIGFAGLRIGYILTSEYLAEMIEKFKPMMEINSFAVQAIKIVCSNKKYLKSAVKNIITSRKNFSLGLKKLNYQTIERDGNFVLVYFGKDREKICKLLEDNNVEYKVLPEPLSKYIRLTVGTDKVMKGVLKIISMASNY